jgi:hypothetical protein
MTSTTDWLEESSSPAELEALEAEAMADGFDRMTAPTSDELRTALPFARETRARLRAVDDQERRYDLPEIRERLGAQYLAAIPAGPPDELLDGQLDPLGHTILYGAGGVGKGVKAASSIVGLVKLGHRVIVLDYENHPDEWARRYEGLAGREGASAVLWVGPLTAAWGGRRGPLWRQADDIRALAEAFEATYVVIDSIVPACGGSDPMEPGTPAQYAGALEFVGRPALSLAHVPKAGGLEFPFGSVFWHNLARVTWSLERAGGQLILTNRKANNYRKLGRSIVEITWREDLPREIWERGYSLALGERIADAIGDDELTPAEVVERLTDDLDEDDPPPKANSIRVALKRGVKAGEFTVDGQRYRRAER